LNSCERGLHVLNEFFDWRGMHVHVQERGKGQPLLLINGLGGSTDMWSHFAEHFPDRRILLFDAPGTGRSSTPTRPMAISMLSDLAASVLDNRDVDTADVLGYSYGGAIAQQMAYDHPERIRRLVLAATNCGVGAVLGSAQAMFVLASPFRFYSETYFRRNAAALYGGLTARDERVRDRMMASRSLFPPSPVGYSLQILGGVSWTSRHFLHEIETETLVISGDDDPLIPLCNAEYLARRIPQARLEIVESAGHLFLCDDAEHIGRRIRRFIGPHAAGSGHPATV
jgi:poly(3-hydroxyalkanoate) depolymerase